MLPTDPIVAERLNSYQHNAQKYTLDPQLEQQQAVQSLNQIITREAQVRAYNDVIAMNGLFAICLFFWGMLNIAWAKYQLRKQQPNINSS